CPCRRAPGPEDLLLLLPWAPPRGGAAGRRQGPPAGRGVRALPPGDPPASARAGCRPRPSLIHCALIRPRLHAPTVHARRPALPPAPRRGGGEGGEGAGSPPPQPPLAGGGLSQAGPATILRRSEAFHDPKIGRPEGKGRIHPEIDDAVELGPGDRIHDL